MDYVQPKTTARSRTTTKLLTLNNITKPLIEWCEILNRDYNAVQKRLIRGWDTKRALNTPTLKPYTRPLGSIPVHKRQNSLQSGHEHPQSPTNT